MAKPFEVTDASFDAEVIKSDKPVLVDFWAPWCGPCRMVAPIVDELSDEYDGKVKFVKLNTDDNVKTAAQYQIRSIPTLLVFKGGEPVGHALQAGAMADRRGVEAGPVVGDGELEMAARARQGYGRLGRAGVFRGVLRASRMQKYTAASASRG